MPSLTITRPAEWIVIATFRPNWQRIIALIAFVFALAISKSDALARGAYVAVGGDPIGSPFFTGTFRPVSSPQGIFSFGGVPAYLNNVTGGLFGGGTGETLIGTVGPSDTLLVGFSIHLADTAGPSHSLSSLSDPALADIVFDLNHPTLAGPIPVTAYEYNAAPSHYAISLAALSAGEAANGGQPFDILIAANNPGLNGIWATDFSGEIGYLDGINALSITDIGAVPEPTTLTILGVLAGPALLCRRRGR